MNQQKRACLHWLNWQCCTMLKQTKNVFKKIHTSPLRLGSMSFKLDEFESTCFYTLYSCILSFDLYQSSINVMKLHFLSMLWTFVYVYKTLHFFFMRTMVIEDDLCWLLACMLSDRGQNVMTLRMRAWKTKHVCVYRVLCPNSTVLKGCLLLPGW